MQSTLLHVGLVTGLTTSNNTLRFCTTLSTYVKLRSRQHGLHCTGPFTPKEGPRCLNHRALEDVRDLAEGSLTRPRFNVGGRTGRRDPSNEGTSQGAHTGRTTKARVQDRIYERVQADFPAFERQLASATSVQERLRTLTTNVDGLQHALSNPQVRPPRLRLSSLRL